MSSARPAGVPDVVLAPALRGALAVATYSYDAVGDLLGTTAQLALARNETTPGSPAHRAAPAGDPGPAVPAPDAGRPAHADRALPGLVDPLVERRHARRLRRRGARPARLPPLCRRRPRLVGGQRPDPRARRPAVRVARRPRAGRQPGLDLAGPADRPRPGRPGPRPRHRLRRPGPAPGRATPTRWSPPTSTLARWPSPGLNAALNDVAASTSATARCGSRSPTSASTWSPPTRRS